MLLQIERDWTPANLKLDVAATDKIVADDWVAQTRSGSQTKAQVFADYKFGDFKLESVTPVEMKVHIFGPTIAVVTGNDLEKGCYKGKDPSGHYVWMDVFVYRQGHWQAVASQWGLMDKK